jgi:hypothetical protein
MALLDTLRTAVRLLQQEINNLEAAQIRKPPRPTKFVRPEAKSSTALDFNGFIYDMARECNLDWIKSFTTLSKVTGRRRVKLWGVADVRYAEKFTAVLKEVDPDIVVKEIDDGRRLSSIVVYY